MPPRNSAVPLSEEEIQQLIEKNRHLQRALLSVQADYAEIASLLERMNGTPWHPALLQRVTATPMGPRALVWVGGAARLVDFDGDLEPDSVAAGDTVYLDSDRNRVMARADGLNLCSGEASEFDRLTGDGRLVAQVRGEELVLEIAARLDPETLRPGDRVLIDRPARMAFERFESTAGRDFLLEDVDDVALSRVGGLREALTEILAVLQSSLIQPELARLYELDGQSAVLLDGPPGCGKTLMVKAAAAEIQRTSGRRCRFAVIRPGEFERPYVGETETNIRSCFARLREEAGDDLAVIFFDEIESIGRIRGAHGAHHADRFLGALLAEIDGFAARGQIAIVAATNRRDLLDPALLSRLSDLQLSVPRPGLESAREILGVHIAEAIPFDATDAAAAADRRREIIETAVSLLYAPNADNEICRIQLRDGTERRVAARELMSGRMLAQIARATREKAHRRHLGGGLAGLTVGDAAEAVADSIDRLSTTLSIHNAHAYLTDLPDDVDVVRVEALRRPAVRGYRYVHAA